MTSGAIVLVVFAGIGFVLSILVLSYRFEIKRLSLQAKLEGKSSSDIDEKVSQLEQKNNLLTKRIETLEAIIIDEDMKMKTGIVDYKDTDDVSQKEKQQNKNIEL